MSYNLTEVRARIASLRVLKEKPKGKWPSLVVFQKANT